MRRGLHRLAAILFVFALALVSNAAQAGIVITVDKSAQQLTVDVNGVQRYRWPVSTGRWGYNTPNGNYRPQRLERNWHSRKYDWAPMPHSIFFNGGYAIHGSNEISRLGRPASHGCIRLHPSNAATLFELVQRNTAAVRIEIRGGRPEEFIEARSSRRNVTRQAEFRPRSRVTRDDYDVRSVRRGASNFEEVFYGPPRPRARRAAQWDDF